jgi:elongation factor G
MSASHTTGDIRNVLLAGHAASGKTTLAEALLVAAGCKNKPGVSDSDPLEGQHGHSIYSSILRCEHDGRRSTSSTRPARRN